MHYPPYEAQSYVDSNDYFENTKDRPPQPLLVETVGYLRLGRANVLDFGSGAGSDARYMLELGYTTTAVDSSELARPYLLELPHQDWLQIVIEDFSKFKFGEYDLINASYSLPFIKPQHFSRIFNDIKQAILPGGIFVGQFFGINDEWKAATDSMSFVSKDQAIQMLAGMDILKMEEIDEDSRLADGTPKHWHFFNIIARKK